ncbi:MAG: hypothetical protein V4507_01225 [Verrucomicrobiota bacterium]
MKRSSYPIFVHLTDSHRASALLLVLTTIAILSLEILGVVQTTQFNVENHLLFAKRDQARRLAESGVAFVLHPLVDAEDPLLEQKINSMESFKVTLVSEGARLNINSILAQNDLPLLTHLFTSWDLSLEESQSLVDAIADWVDADNVRRLNGAESDDYDAAGLSSKPKNRSFQSVGEMETVMGIGILEKKRPDWREAFTVWSEGPLDLNEASAELISIAAEVGLPQAESLVQYRTIVDPNDRTKMKKQKLVSLDQAAQIMGISPDQFTKVSRRLTVNSQTFRIKSTGIVDHFTHTIEAVVRRNIQPVVYLLWSES